MGREGTIPTRSGQAPLHFQYEEKRDFSHPHGDAFAGAKEEKKAALLRSK